jgi:aminotransferase EvaB
MGVRFNDLGRTSELERSALLEDIEMILESGSFLNGLFSERLRSILKSSLSVNGVTLVGNGTDALRVALMSLGVTSGSRVVTVGNAGGYASGAALSLGATPVPSNPVSAPT